MFIVIHFSQKMVCLYHSIILMMILIQIVLYLMIYWSAKWDCGISKYW